MSADHKVDKLEEAIRRLVEKDDSDTYNKVRSYLYDNPNSNVLDVAEATNIPRSKILKYLKEGKLINNAMPMKDEKEQDKMEDNSVDKHPRITAKTSYRRSSRRK